LEYIAGFLSAALVGILSAAAAYYFALRRERGTRLAERRQRIYLMLLELKQTHFWISSGDMPMPDRDIPPEIKDQYWTAAWRIIDELRAADDLRQGPDVIDALIGLGFEHEWQRAEQLGRIIHDLGRDVTPRVAKALQQRDRAAMELMHRNSDEWWRRRGKIEPFIQTPKQRERSMRVDETDNDDEASGKPT
jgi:hypothetical protein